MSIRGAFSGTATRFWPGNVFGVIPAALRLSPLNPPLSTPNSSHVTRHNPLARTPIAEGRATTLHSLLQTRHHPPSIRLPVRLDVRAQFAALKPFGAMGINAKNVNGRSYGRGFCVYLDPDELGEGRLRLLSHDLVQ